MATPKVCAPQFLLTTVAKLGMFLVARVQGLVVPVLRDATHMNYAQIEKGINELGVKVHLKHCLLGNGRQT